MERGLGEAAGYVLPLKALPPVRRRNAVRRIQRRLFTAADFRSSPWPLRREHLYLIPGDSPLGLRLPLASLPWVAPGDKEEEYAATRLPSRSRSPTPLPAAADEALDKRNARSSKPPATPKTDYDPREIVHTALCAEVREGVLHVFLPPVPLLEDFVDAARRDRSHRRRLACRCASKAIRRPPIRASRNSGSRPIPA
jgi:uncharacterized protein (DUF2126 family)